MPPPANAYDDPAAVAAWQRAAATRSAYLAGATRRMLELGDVAPGSRVLVVGGGTGEDALAVVERTGGRGEVVVTDVSVAMTAKAATALAGARGVDCIAVDAQHLSFASQSFDAVVARNSLMFVPDLALALNEIRRVLRPGGRLAATVWASAADNPRLATPLAAARRIGARPKQRAVYRVALRLGSEGRLAAALRAARFSGVAIERLRVTARYGRLEEAVAEAMDHAGTKEVLKLLPPGSEERLRRALVRRWRSFAGPRGVELPGVQLIASGTAPVE